VRRSPVTWRVVIAAVTLVCAVARADRIDDLSRSLEGDADEKARIAAAVALGRLADTRGVPALVHALGDRSTVVRGVAATALGHIGDPRAIPALERALGDDNASVRARIRDALGALRAKQGKAPPDDKVGQKVAPKESPRHASKAKVYIQVKPMANKAARGPKDLGDKMRGFVEAELGRSADVTLDAGSVNQRMSQLVVDGAITELDRSASGHYVEVSCQVKLTISTPDGRIVSMVTGGAKVSEPRSHYKPAMDKGLQVDALQNAVRGAHQNMVAWLGRYVAQK